MANRSAAPLVGFLVLLVSPVLAQTPCGSDPGDAALVTAVVDTGETTCNCCRRGSVAPCAASIVKAAGHEGRLPGRCVASVTRHVRRDCAFERHRECGKIGGCFDPAAGMCTGIGCFPSGPPGYCREYETCRDDCPPVPGKLLWRFT